MSDQRDIVERMSNPTDLRWAKAITTNTHRSSLEVARIIRASDEAAGMVLVARDALEKIAALKDMQSADPFTAGSYNQGHCAGSSLAYDEAAEIAIAALKGQKP